MQFTNIYMALCVESYWKYIMLEVTFMLFDKEEQHIILSLCLNIELIIQYNSLFKKKTQNVCFFPQICLHQTFLLTGQMSLYLKKLARFMYTNTYIRRCFGQYWFQTLSYQRTIKHYSSIVCFCFINKV